MVANFWEIFISVKESFRISLIATTDVEVFAIVDCLRIMNIMVTAINGIREIRFFFREWLVK